LIQKDNGDYTGALFKRFTVTDGFPYQTYRLVCDENNNIWSLVQGSGLFMYNQSSGETKLFKGQQIIRGEAWGGAQYCDKNGFIYMQALDGLTIFHPDSVMESNYIPEIQITDIKILNKSIFTDPDTTILDFYRIQKSLRLPYSSNTVSFEFASLSFTEPEVNRFKYYLEGYDKEPYMADASYRVATYNKLPPGKYTFKVFGSNNNNIWNDTGTSIRVVILRPWYGTIPAYVVYVLIFAGLIAYLWFNEMRRIRLRHEVQLKQVESDKLRELDHMKSEFFSNISHEFRTPLTLILAPLENILNGSFTGNLRKEAEIMNRNARRLLNLINQILDLAKIDSGRLHLNAAEQDLGVFLKDAVSNFESAARNKKIELICQVPRKPVLIYFDNEKMEDILENIINNALKFNHAGGKVMIKLELKDKTDGERVRMEKPLAEITIQDTGIGISDEDLDRIFDRFYQADSSRSRRYEGAGIGLSLASELVKLHHGMIKVKSSRGKGTTFIISLPLGRDHLSDNEIVSAPPLPFPEFKMEGLIEDTMMHDQPGIPGRIDITSRKMNLPLILLVEDNADMRHFIKHNLDHQFIFIEAENGIKGFDTAVETIPDLIISDVMMPVMDGIEFCRKIREDGRTSHIPVILLTARADKDSRITGFDTGADDYVIKPFEQEVMISRMNNLLKERKMLREKFAHQWIETGTTSHVNDTDKKFLQTINELLEKNYTNHNFTTQVFTKITGMSRSVLFRKLKAVTNLSPNTYLRNFRLIKAAEMIRSGEKNISLVAFSTGFNNLSYFSRCFKRMFNAAPHDF
jgi:signal transduction histidine kinase/DNA-binding response OmpR family regulator